MQSVAVLVCLLGTTLAFPLSPFGNVGSKPLPYPPSSRTQGLGAPVILDMDVHPAPFAPSSPTQGRGAAANLDVDVVMPMGYPQQMLPSVGFSNPMMPQYPGRMSLEILYPFGYPPQAQQPMYPF
uniref:Secretory calcium-binding phosphosphoprotein proline-glutamine-rich 6 n=1 Tax=Lepisosteus oculatus TaxID=7918 RepID=A0A125R3M4_LEPOC|nr:secretory calcium-binding phosphosphoprotein proline-glutamine-rich 6 [Lepisosteus oculatus]